MDPTSHHNFREAMNVPFFARWHIFDKALAFANAIDKEHHGHGFDLSIHVTKSNEQALNRHLPAVA
jgi:hypothetical protein